MKNKKNRKKSNFKSVCSTIGILASIFAIGFAINKINSPMTVAPSALKDEPTSSYGIAEMQMFWSNRFQRIFEQELFKNNYPIKEVQERYNFNAQKILERYGENYSVSFSTNYCEAGREILAGCKVTNGSPELILFMPALMDIDWLLKNKQYGGSETSLYYAVTTGIIHEMDHLAFGKMNSTRTLDELVKEEKETWALTCEYVLKPLIEIHQVKLTESEYAYYSNWVRTGQTTLSPDWERFIRSRYETTRR